MSIRERMMRRAETRKSCRALADELFHHIITEVDKVPEHEQTLVLQMVLSELQIASRQDKPHVSQVDQAGDK